MTFQDLNLNKQLLKALEEMKISVPTVIQERAFSAIMSGKDVAGIAQTGTGKTLAYLLPLLRQTEFAKDRLPRILIIVPTRELVMQIVETIKELTAFSSLQVNGIYGGKNIKTQIKELAEGQDIVVGTPGRMLDLLLNGAIRPKALKKLVIDEVDEMMDLGFRPQIERVLDLLPVKRQNLMFSATITDDVQKLLATFFNNPLVIEAAPTGTPLDQIEQLKYHVPNFYTKSNLLSHLIISDKSLAKVLVFVSGKKLADQLFDEVADIGSTIAVIHSNKSQNTRFNTVNDFHAGKIRILIATDLVSRGLDISEVTHVINFDLPMMEETYIHRIGRTGRAEKSGTAISFVTEADIPFFEKIEQFMHKTVNLAPFPEEVEISTMLTEEEDPRTETANITFKQPDIIPGGAFHEKLEKNKKVNKKVSHKFKMMQKYGKPKTRGQKKSKRK
jgi:ATP-dependent RNA helicase RhlE